MIIKDNTEKGAYAENISDITEEIKAIESIISEAAKNRKNGGSLTDEEREALNIRIKDLQTVISNLDDATKKKANAMELIAFIKELTKFKKLVDGLKKDAEND